MNKELSQILSDNIQISPDYVVAIGEKAINLGLSVSKLLEQTLYFLIAEPIYYDNLLVGLIAGSNDGVIWKGNLGTSKDKLKLIQNTKILAISKNATIQKKGFKILPSNLTSKRILAVCNEENLEVCKLNIELIKLYSPIHIQLLTSFSDREKLVLPGGALDSCIVLPPEFSNPALQNL